MLCRKHCHGVILGGCPGGVWLEVGPRRRVSSATLRHAAVPVSWQWSSDLVYDHDYTRYAVCWSRLIQLCVLLTALDGKGKLSVTSVCLSVCLSVSVPVQRGSDLLYDHDYIRYGITTYFFTVLAVDQTCLNYNCNCNSVVINYNSASNCNWWNYILIYI